jgi:hypothetical protein
MSPRSFRRRGGRCLLAALLVPAVLAAPSPAADPPGPEPRVEAGKNLSAAAALFARSDREGLWRGVEPGAALFSRDLLLALPGGRAVVEPRPDSVSLTLWGNLPQLSTFPGLESAVVLHDSRAYDLDFSLVRGRVVVTSARAKGPARVWVRLPGAAWELTLAERGDAIALESYGRWPRGVPFTKEARPGEGPTIVVAATVLKGRVELAAGDTRFTLTAPPGPAYFRWDSVVGAEAGPERRDQLPSWADPKAPRPADAAAAEQVVTAFQGGLKGRPPAAALSDLLDGADRETDKAKAAVVREFAILGLAAVDELPRVAQALGDPKHASARDTATVALRHWIGESAGRDPVLYFVLTQQLNYSDANAETVLQMLHSPFRADEPDGLRALLAYLRHDRLAVRSLALWHLRRLVPAGKDIPFDPAAPEADREKGYAEWKKVIASRSGE